MEEYPTLRSASFGWAVPFNNRKKNGRTVIMNFMQIFTIARLPRKVWTEKKNFSLSLGVHLFINELKVKARLVLEASNSLKKEPFFAAISIETSFKV